MENTYNTGSIESSVATGGLVGCIDNATSLNNVYNIGTVDTEVSSSGYAGGIIGLVDNVDTIEAGENLYSLSASGPTAIIGNQTNMFANGILSWGLMQSQSSYGFGFGTYGEANDGFIWASAEIIENGELHTYALPRLWFEELIFGEAEIVKEDAGGTETDPFLIASAEDFNKYAKAEYFGNAEYYFKQISNITSSALTQTTLAGHYDGGNYTITSSNSNKAIS